MRLNDAAALLASIPCFLGCTNDDVEDGTTSNGAAGGGTGNTGSGAMTSATSSTGSGGASNFDPSSLLLWDTQPNALSPDDANPLAVIQANEPRWEGLKVMNSIVPWSSPAPPTASIDCTPALVQPPGIGSGSHAHGFIYTVEPNDVPEYGGVIPGFNQRAYMFESWSASCDGQEDWFLQFGNAPGDIPGDVWFQFWYFQEADPTWNHDYGHPKFIYPTRVSYPAQTEMYDWMLSRNFYPGLPHGNVVNVAGERYVNFKHPGIMSFPTEWAVANSVSDIGHGLLARPMELGVWQSWRLHMNASQAAQEEGRALLEAYVRNYGEQEFTLVTRWQQGLEAYPVESGENVAFNWALNGAVNGYGHAAFRTPANVSTTFGTFHNSRYALSDFAMCAGVDDGGPGEAALPGHSDYGH